MTNTKYANELPPLGITFYCPSHEDFRKVYEIRVKLIDAGIPSLWVKKEYNGRMVDALDVYGNANIIAGFLPATNS